ncbi:unnamed protein product [Darwinula stevensoni]|uniref:Histone acetyltransferase n=1 Tax=Darwinula stevensoni TaxID=69355 RepID=A0A7R8X5P7_9CRUS|nr:unnamed protein product [Darwinula stevensoni]CAG0880333.1 unnamed protein product [Darwinula stevensoni]
MGYQLTRMEEKIGSPEKPLSDLGLISYRNYWRDAVLSYLCNFDGTSEISIKGECVRDAVWPKSPITTPKTGGRDWTFVV